ncbi:putative bacteriocin transport accessory protein [Mycoplasma sp. CAG:776]|nr:putative bacteriocin transport accessory protein [Mycoplasma sp. CAG:776]
MEEKIKNLTFIVILGFIIMFILIIGLYFKDGTTTTETTNKGTSGGSATSDTEYDVSEMNEVDLEEAVALFDEKGTHVLYMGRSACTYCRQFVPVLNEVQEDLGFTTNYLDVNTIANIWNSQKKNTDEGKALLKQVKELTDKITIEATANGEKGKLGDLFVENGFTPATIVIKDGKVVEGFFGYRNAETLTELLEKYL